MKTTKSILLLAVMFILSVTTTNAQQNQRIAYVDSNYILENIPEYSDAQEEINALSEKWEKEIKELKQTVEEMYREYQSESVLLSEDQKRKKEEAILAKDQEVKTLQMKYFGPAKKRKVSNLSRINGIQNGYGMKKSNYGFILYAGIFRLRSNRKAQYIKTKPLTIQMLISQNIC